MLGKDLAAIAENDGPLDAILQLADVPGPWMMHHDLLRFRRDRQALSLQLPAVHREKMLDEQRDVLPAVAKRRDDEREHVQPVIEVLAEGMRGHRRQQVLVGGRHDADVRLDRRRAADPHEPLALQHAEEFGLKAHVHVADLIEEHRALVRQLELAQLPAGRAGEGAALMPEQLALQQLPGDGRAVDGHERSVLARAAVMDHPGEELLAGAALPEQKHGRGADRDLLRLLLRVQQGTALADHLRVLGLRELFLEDQILGDELTGIQGLPDDDQEVVRVHRLLQEIERPVLDGLHGGLDRPVCGHDEDGDHGILLLDRLQDLQARLSRQLKIGQDEVHFLPPKLLDSLLPIDDHDDRMPFHFHVPGQHLSHAFVVFNEQNRGHVRPSGDR